MGQATGNHRCASFPVGSARLCSQKSRRRGFTRVLRRPIETAVGFCRSGSRAAAHNDAAAHEAGIGHFRSFTAAQQLDVRGRGARRAWVVEIRPFNRVFRTCHSLDCTLHGRDYGRHFATQTCRNSLRLYCRLHELAVHLLFQTLHLACNLRMEYCDSGEAGRARAAQCQPRVQVQPNTV
jgi:hypothetical protein